MRRAVITAQLHGNSASMKVKKCQVIYTASQTTRVMCLKSAELNTQFELIYLDLRFGPNRLEIPTIRNAVIKSINTLISCSLDWLRARARTRQSADIDVYLPSIFVNFKAKTLMSTMALCIGR